MRFIDLVRSILKKQNNGLSPQEIREEIKTNYPDFYGTESHKLNIEKGHYKDLDHALLAQIYVSTRSVNDIEIDRTHKPIKLKYILDLDNEINERGGELADSENLEKLEAGIGFLYILGTNLYTQDGFEIIKIGITTGSIEKRVNQLYTTGVPLKFRILKVLETKNYAELEVALHKLLATYRVNTSREFFVESCLPHAEKIIEIHKVIQES